jgi:hypothetical protein
MAVTDFLVAVISPQALSTSMQAHRRAGVTRMDASVHAGDGVMDRTALHACECGEHEREARGGAAKHERGPGA